MAPTPALAPAAPPIRIWFNRTFATTVHLIEMLRANPDGRPVHVISTHVDPDSPVLAVADERYPEPDINGADYAHWAVEFARANRVDLLIPRAHMADLAAARARFEAVGTTLACPGERTVRLFDDKAAAYVAAAALGIPVPPYAVVRNAADLRAAYDRFAAFGAVCMKPTTGVGGDGYRRLTDEPPRWSDFAGEVRSLVRVDDVCAAIETSDDFDNPDVPGLLVLPFLDGDEVSVDVLADPDGKPLTMVGRLHTSGRRRVIVADPRAFEVARILTTEHRISHLSNTQIRYWQGPDDTEQQPYLLEVNTRAAGGLFQTSLAGVNLAWLSVLVALGEPVGPILPSFGAVYTQLAVAVPLTIPR